MFIIKTEQDKIRAIDFIRQMALHPVQYIDIDDYKKHRTTSQNRYFHKCVKVIADHTGYTLEEVKDKIVLSVWEPTVRTVTVVKNGKREEKTLIERKSTASLDTKEFSDLVNAVMIVAHTLQIVLPEPDDFKEMMRER
jgi:hypothetical protein